jgi:hypothetical protein
VKAGCGLDAAAGDLFLSMDSGGTKNFTGELSQVFSCLALLGTMGCGYEHQLQALRASFLPSVNPENRNFLRPDAALGIVILSDEDDCSGDPDAEFYADLIPGQAGSFRCATLGHVCNGQPVPATAGFEAPLTACVPYLRSPGEQRTRLINVSDFVDAVAATKQGNLSRIAVATIIGWSDDAAARYGVIERPAGSAAEVDLRPVCTSSATGNAAPGIRLRSFAQAFPNHAVHTICSQDLTPAMTDIGQRMAALLH